MGWDKLIGTDNNADENVLVEIVVASNAAASAVAHVCNVFVFVLN